MRICVIIFSLLLISPVFAQTYTDSEFVVSGETRTTPVCAPGTTTVTTTTYQPVAVQPGATVVTTVTAGESPIYVGMSRQHLLDVMGHPTYVEKFRRFAARNQGIYDEVWTYQAPTGVTYVYIKERRVNKIEYR